MNLLEIVAIARDWSGFTSAFGVLEATMVRCESLWKFENRERGHSYFREVLVAVKWNGASKDIDFSVGLKIIISHYHHYFYNNNKNRQRFLMR